MKKTNSIQNLVSIFPVIFFFLLLPSPLLANIKMDDIRGAIESGNIAPLVELFKKDPRLFKIQTNPTTPREDSPLLAVLSFPLGPNRRDLEWNRDRLFLALSAEIKKVQAFKKDPHYFGPALLKFIQLAPNDPGAIRVVALILDENPDMIKKDTKYLEEAKRIPGQNPELIQLLIKNSVGNWQNLNVMDSKKCRKQGNSFSNLEVLVEKLVSINPSITEESHAKLTDHDQNNLITLMLSYTASVLQQSRNSEESKKWKEIQEFFTDSKGVCVGLSVLWGLEMRKNEGKSDKYISLSEAEGLLAKWNGQKKLSEIESKRLEAFIKKLKKFQTKQHVLEESIKDENGKNVIRELSNYATYFNSEQLERALAEAIKPGRLIIISNARHGIGVQKGPNGKLYYYDPNNPDGAVEMNENDWRQLAAHVWYSIGNNEDRDAWGRNKIGHRNIMFKVFRFPTNTKLPLDAEKFRNSSKDLFHFYSKETGATKISPLSFLSNLSDEEKFNIIINHPEEKYLKLRSDIIKQSWNNSSLYARYLLDKFNEEFQSNERDNLLKSASRFAFQGKYSFLNERGSPANSADFKELKKRKLRTYGSNAHRNRNSFGPLFEGK